MLDKLQEVEDMLYREMCLKQYEGCEKLLKCLKHVDLAKSALYYEEKMINSKKHYRNNPNKHYTEWKQ